MSITLTVLGCSGSTSGPDSPASGYLLQAPWHGRTFTLLLDCGPGVFGAVYRHLDPAGIDAIALSHLHPDHCLDLCAYYVAARYSPTAPWPPVDLWAPPGALERLSRAYEPTVETGVESDSEPGSDPAADLGSAFVPHEWAPTQQIGPFTVRTAPTAHPAPCWATRFERDGVALVYTGDTGPCPALTDLATGAELLLSEAAFVEPGPGAEPNPDGVHLTGAQAGLIAARAGVGRLVLTHVPPWHDPEQARAEARTTFRGRIDLATPGLRLDV